MIVGRLPVPASATTPLNQAGYHQRRRVQVGSQAGRLTLIDRSRAISAA